MFEPAFMRLALIASIATGAALGVMGVYLVFRRVIFLGLVLANAATAGAAVGQVFGWTPEVASVVATVLSALGLGAFPASRRISAESLMGWAYAAASSATVLILARSAAADADTLHLLFGNLLAVSASHAVALVIVAIAIGLLHILFSGRFLLVTFDREAASVAGVNTSLWSLGLNLSIGIAVAAAIHELGALLTFGLLTLPAMAALLFTRSVQATFITAAILGTSLPCVGLALSFYYDLPSGPAAVGLLAFSVFVAGIVGHRRS